MVIETLQAVLRNRRGVIILLFSVLVGLNVVALSSYFAFAVINSVDQPFPQLSNQKFVSTFALALAAPLFALVTAIVGYYFGSTSARGNLEFRGRAGPIIESDELSIFREGALAKLSATLKAIVVLIGHLAIAAIMLVLIKGLETLTTLTLSAKQGLLFDRLPLRYIFDVMDLTVLLIFGIFGLLSAASVLRESSMLR